MERIRIINNIIILSIKIFGLHGRRTIFNTVKILLSFGYRTHAACVRDKAIGQDRVVSSRRSKGRPYVVGGNDFGIFTIIFIIMIRTKRVDLFRERPLSSYYRIGRGGKKATNRRWKKKYDYNIEMCI